MRHGGGQVDLLPGRFGPVGLLIQPRILDVGGHDHLRTRFDSQPEGDQFLLVELVQGLFHPGEPGVAVRIRISVSGEMLEDRDGPALRHTLHKGCAAGGDCQKVIRKGPDTDHGVLRIVVDIHDRSEGRIDRDGRKLLSDLQALLPGILRVAGGRDGHIAGPADSLPQAADNAALLVGRDQQRDLHFAVRLRIGLLHVIHQSQGLPALPAVFSV